MALDMKRRGLRLHEARLQDSSQFQPQDKDGKIAHPLGESYDFWKCEGDSIYDELYGDDV